MEDTKPMLKCNSNTNNGGNCSPRLPMEFLSISLSHSLPSLVSKSGMMSSHSHFEKFHSNNNKQKNSFAGNSFSFASSVNSQLVLERIMNQSQVSPLTSGRPSWPLGNGGQSCGSIADQLPLHSPPLLCTIKGSARNSVAFLLIILILLSIINPCVARPFSKDGLWQDTRAGWLFGPDFFYALDKIREFIARNGVIGSLTFLLTCLLICIVAKKLLNYMEEKLTKVDNYLWEPLRAWMLMEIREISRAGFKLMVDWGSRRDWVLRLIDFGQQAFTRGKLFWRRLTFMDVEYISADPSFSRAEADRIRREALFKRYT